MSRNLVIALVLGGGAFLVAGFFAARAMLTRLKQSAAADRLGIANTPTPEAAQRLSFVARWAVPILSIVQEAFPEARITSGYRNAEVNAAVGGVPTSRHLKGLAFDLGGLGGFAGAVGAAKHLRANAHRLPEAPRRVLAESTPPHVHISFYDPLGIIDAERFATAWRKEKSEGGFEVLA